MNDPINWTNPFSAEADLHSQWLAEVAYAAAQEDMDRVEVAVENSIQSGEYGVLVVYRDGRVWKVGVHHSVPYGYVHEFRHDDDPYPEWNPA